MNLSWLQDLRSPDWQKRRQAIERLAQEPPEALRQGLLTLLRTQHQDINALNAALQLIARLGDTLLQPLIALLDDPDPEVRLYTAQALGLLRTEQAVPALLTHVDDADPRVRFHVLEALALIQTPVAREAFLHVLTTSDLLDLRFAALEGLAQLHDPTLIPVLASYLDHPDLAPQVAAALGQTQEPLALWPLLQRHMWDFFWPAYAALAQDVADTPAASRLEALVLENVPAAQWPDLLTALSTEMVATQRAALPLLARLLDRASADLSVPLREALLTLWRQPDLTEAVTPLLAQVHGDLSGPLLEALQTGTPPLAASAAYLLGRLGVRTALPHLLQALEDGESALAAAAAQALGHLGDLHAADPLLQALAHPAPEVSQAALEALLTLHPPSLAADLRVRLEDPHPQVRAAALQGLARLTPQEALADLLAALDDPHPQVRQTAVQALAEHAAPQARAALLERLSHGAPDLQTAILRTLTGRFAPEERPHLLEALRNPMPWVRLHACQALRHLPPDPETRQTLHALLDDPLPPVRANALRALSTMPDATLETRAAALLQAQEPDLRLAAAEALAACDTPQAAEHLLAALSHWPEEEKPFLWRALARMTVPQAQASLRAALNDPRQRHRVLEALVAASPAPTTLPLLVEALRHPSGRAQARRGWLRHPPEQAWAALEEALHHAPPHLAPALLAEARFLPPQVASPALQRLAALTAPALHDAACLVWRTWGQPLPQGKALDTPNCTFWSITP